MAIYIPSIITDTNGTEHMSDLRSEMFFKKRLIIIDDEIDSDLATSIVSQMLYLNSKSDSDIYMMIDSPGGSVSAGNRIYHYMKTGCRCDCVTIANGVAASMGAFLLAAGTKGKRYVTPSSEIMIHQPLGGTQGQATEIEIAAKHILRTKEKLNKILAANTGRDYEVIAADTERDNWKTAQEALEYGLIDKVIENRTEI